jgi:hypothetical protein
MPRMGRPDLCRQQSFFWFAPLMAAAAICALAGFDGLVSAVLLLPFFLGGLVGGCYAVSRINRFGWNLDRTPAPAPWLDTDDGRLLVDELRRSSLADLSGVTLETEVFHDLGIHGEEMAALLKGLARSRGGGTLPLEGGPYSPDFAAFGRANAGAYPSLTIGMLLDAMAVARGAARG